MKCLLCNFTTNEKSKLENHYIKFHNVDKNNVLFNKLMNQKTKVIYGRKCTNCNEFVFSEKATHDFLKHYDKGFLDKNLIDFTVNKPLKVTNIGDIHKFEITFKEHSSSYDFFDSVGVVENFLNIVKDKIPLYKSSVLISAGFSIENIQQALNNYTQPLTQSRYWSTEPIQARFFNDFVYFKIKESILKRVINNRLSGSAWNFHKFNYINVKILKTTDQLVQ